MLAVCNTRNEPNSSCDTTRYLWTTLSLCRQKAQGSPRLLEQFMDQVWLLCSEVHRCAFFCVKEVKITGRSSRHARMIWILTWYIPVLSSFYYPKIVLNFLLIVVLSIEIYSFCTLFKYQIVKLLRDPALAGLQWGAWNQQTRTQSRGGNTISTTNSPHWVRIRGKSKYILVYLQSIVFKMVHVGICQDAIQQLEPEDEVTANHAERVLHQKRCQL